jgi:hypothetical protein
MLKKMTILAATLMLLLVTAQLAMAQQDMGTTQPVQDEQTATPAGTGQQDASQAQPAEGAQGALPSLEGVVRLNENNNLVVNCAGVSEGLAQLQQLRDAQATDPQLLAVLEQAETLAQLCASSGYTPSSAGEPSAAEPSGSNSTGASPEQTQQSG